MKSPEGNQGSPEEIEEAEGRMTPEEALSSEWREKKLKHEILLKEAVSDLYDELLFRTDASPEFLELVAEKMIEKLGEIYVFVRKETELSCMQLWAEKPKEDGSGDFEHDSQRDISLGVGQGKFQDEVDLAIRRLKDKFELVSEEEFDSLFSVDSRLYHFKKKIKEATGEDTV